MLLPDSATGERTRHLSLSSREALSLPRILLSPLRDIARRRSKDCRLVYAVVEGRPSHYNAAIQVFSEGDGSRVVRTIGVLPEKLAPAVGGMMDEAAKVMRKTLVG